ncbi:MAG TPA: glycoside hydrolase family 6 protein [Polyangia bacterium]|nr:glycoside hydrolase family 6 protein [Polyangia bacterium]
MKADQRRLGWLVMGFGFALAACAAAPKPSPVVPSTTPHAPDGVNPFEGAHLYINPDYAKTVEGLAVAHPDDAALLKKMATFPTAIWLSWIADTKDVGRYLDDALAQQKASGKPEVVTFVVYDLPNRDCNAASSAGELSADDTGEAGYQHRYIDVIAAAFAAHPDVRIAAVLEPDSLANLVTNLQNPKCEAAQGIYKRGIAYAITKLSLPNVFLYLDAAHAGWLGWPKNLGRSVTMYKEVLTMAGGADRIRGFALNVSNYDPAKDATNPKRQLDAAPDDELGYVGDLSKALDAAGITGKGFVIDTGRDGKGYIRSSPGNWCNIKGAGLGERPRAAPAPKVDAYLYIKVPGESDGTADAKATRFDENCVSEDATPGAPEAGKMFDAYLINLLKNATPPL